MVLRIGIVKPTFTAAAYSGYYNYSTGYYAFFYSPHLNHQASAANTDHYNYLPYPPESDKDPIAKLGNDSIARAGKLGKQTFQPITDHLEMLSPKIPTTQDEVKHLEEIPSPIGEKYNPYRILNIAPHIKNMIPEADVVVLTDEDIHEGHTTNFDIIILGHNEYVTQQEYDNLKNFVANGGTLICLDGNIFYCEVSYDKVARTVTLVRGHRWVFDGRQAYWYKPLEYFEDSGERWEKETSEWLGSNYAYLTGVYGTEPGYFYYLSNRLIDRIGYRSFGEDQRITNYEGVKIIQDWGPKSPFPDVPLFRDVRIACYEKPYRKGKSIVFGIYSDMVIDNPEFLNFFDGVLLGNAIASSIAPPPKCDLSQIIQSTLDGKENTIRWLLSTIEEKDAEIKRIVNDVGILQKINLNHQKTLHEKDAQLKRAVKDVGILQGINVGHQKSLAEKDKEIKSLKMELQDQKRAR